MRYLRWEEKTNLISKPFISKHTIKPGEDFSGDIFIEYSAFHEEISSDSHSDTVIELTSDCLPILENFVSCALTVDSPDINGYFDSEYKSGLQNLKEARTDRLVQVIDI